jgi:hypothetical protein
MMISMYTLCVVLANGIRFLLDVVRGAAAMTWLKFYRAQGARVSLRNW